MKFSFLLVLALLLSTATKTAAQTTANGSASHVEIADIRFQGNHEFQSNELVGDMKQCLARYQNDRPNAFRSDTFEYCLRGLANIERSKGYLQARFGEPSIQELGQWVVITVNSDEGILYRVGNLEIEGADHVSEEQIREMIGIRRGEIANGEKIARAMYEDLKAVYGDKGFIQYTAEIEPIFHSEPGDVDGIADFKITIDEGRRFKIHRISFFGDDVPQVELRQLLLVREGDVYSQRLFEQSVLRINDSGWFNSIDKDKDVDYRTNEEEGLVDVTIKLTKRGAD